MKMLKLIRHLDEHGVSVVLGAILVLGIGIAVGSLVYSQYVQSTLHSTEANFMNDVGGKFVQLKGATSPQVLELNWYPKSTRFHTEYQVGEELDHLAFVVDDPKKVYAELIKNGATSAVSPKESKGTEVYVKDPDGIWIELLG